MQNCIRRSGTRRIKMSQSVVSRSARVRNHQPTASPARIRNKQQRQVGTARPQKARRPVGKSTRLAKSSTPTSSTVRGSLSVVIPAFGRAPLIGTLIRRLRSWPAVKEVIVVANHCPSDTLKRIAGSSARLISYPEPLGHDTGRAIGAMAATGKYVMFLDADINWTLAELRPFLRSLTSGSDVALNRYPTRDNPRYHHPTAVAKRALNLALDRPDLQAASMTAVPHAIRRDVIEAIGPEHLATPPVFCTLAILKGYRVVAAALSQVGLRNPQPARRPFSYNLKDVILGDHAEAFYHLIRHLGERGYFIDSIRNRAALPPASGGAGDDVRLVSTGPLPADAQSPTSVEVPTIGQTSTSAPAPTVGQTPTPARASTVAQTPTPAQASTIGQTPTPARASTVGQTSTSARASTTGQTSAAALACRVTRTSAVLAVVPARNEGKTIAQVIRHINRAGVREVCVVENGSSDGTAQYATNSGANVLHFDHALGHDVPRAIGALNHAEQQVSPTLFVDADFPVAAQNLRPFVRAVTSRGVDVALNNLSQGVRPLAQTDPVSTMKRFLNLMVGRPDLKISSPTAIPHALSARALQCLAPVDLAVPPRMTVQAVLQGLNIAAVHYVDVVRPNRRRKINHRRPGRGSGTTLSVALTRLIIGDHLEAMALWINAKGPRGGYRQPRRMDLLAKALKEYKRDGIKSGVIAP